MKNLSEKSRISYQETPGKSSQATADVLRNNKWPRSFPYLVALGYLSLVIIRPWEHLFPWMAAIHFEKTYVIFMLVTVLFSRNKQPVMSLQSLTVLIFSILLLINCFTAYHFSMAYDEFYMYLALVLFFFVMLTVMDTPYALTFMIAFYIFIMALYLGKSQWEFWLHGRHRYTMGVIRLVGIESSYGGPNSLAMSIVVSLPFAYFLWRHKREFTSLWPGKWSKCYSVLLITYGILSFGSIIMTNSRSGIVSLLFFLMLLFFSKKGFFKKIGYVFIGIIFLSFLWQIMPAENQNRWKTIWSPEEGPQNAETSAEGRIEGFKAGMVMFYRHPIFGVGLGNFVDYRTRKVDGVPLQAHNLAGQVMGELGLLGTILFLLMVFSIFGACNRIKRLANTGVKNAVFWVDLSTACRNSVLLLFFAGLFGHNMLRYNWLWAAAFATKGLYFLKNAPDKILKEGGDANRKDL